jgi:hypothetical protein
MKFNMKLARKKFSWPSTKIVVRTEERGIFNRRTVEIEDEVIIPIEEVFEEVKRFVESIGPDRLVSLNEYTRAYDRIGDDGMMVVSVWYWKDE